MKVPDMSTQEANTVIDPLIVMRTVEWSIFLQWSVGSEKKFKKD